MNIPEEYRWVYEEAESSKNGPTPFTGAAIMQLIERIAALTEQLHKCAVAARSYEDAVAMGEPFGDEVKAVLTLRQNADAGFAELAQARAEFERLKAPLPENALCQGDGKCPGVCGGCLELTTNREYRLAIALRDARSERDSFRAQLEQMRRPVTDEEWVGRPFAYRSTIDALLAARARRQEKP